MKRALSATILAGFCVTAMGWSTLAQSGQAARPQPQDMSARLLAGLRDTQGCLKVEAVRFQDGRLAIMAWFENKAAVERWYHHEAHRRMISMTGANPDAHTPLQHVTDPDQPMLVIASMVIDPANQRVPGPMPLREISIELFAPVPGGATIGGRLSPEGFKVPHMRVLDVQARPAGTPGAPSR